ncbi:MAG: hypothetical protein KatS3mg056_1738 [Chloroflexus sp.]|nr:MAG: hypothetical protein KatS3mg056_1738 [Chloroflexus sp.]
MLRIHHRLPVNVLFRARNVRGAARCPCKRCDSFTRLIQRKLIEWSRWPVEDQAHTDLPDVDEIWLRRTCKAELVYKKRVERIPKEWLEITEIKEILEQRRKSLDNDSRIVLAELQIHFIPLTEVTLDLGRQGDWRTSCDIRLRA